MIVVGSVSGLLTDDRDGISVSEAYFDTCIRTDKKELFRPHSRYLPYFSSFTQVAMSPGEDGLIGIPFPEHSNELLSHLNDQRRAGLLCDLTLTSRGAHYPTHRSVMAAVSLYFRRLFGAEEGGGEGGGGFSVCQLDCVAPDALDALLEFAYTATLTIPSSGMRDVLQGAQVLGIQCVADACRDILGETAEIEGDTAEEQRAQHTATERMASEQIIVEKGSRRKIDRKKLKNVGPHHINSSILNPSSASPISHSSPASDSLRSLPSTQPPSPEQGERHQEFVHNGNLRQMREPGRGATVNGGPLHRLHPPPVQALNDKLSEDDDMEGCGDDAMLMGSTSLSTSAAERGAAATAAGGGRKRKSQTPQQCPVCQKIIHGAGKLPRHMRTHTGEKPFQCTACGVRFTRYGCFGLSVLSIKPLSMTKVISGTQDKRQVVQYYYQRLIIDLSFSFLFSLLFLYLSLLQE